VCIGNDFFFVFFLIMGGEVRMGVVVASAEGLSSAQAKLEGKCRAIAARFNQGLTHLLWPRWTTRTC